MVAVKIISIEATFVEADLKKWEKRLEKLEEHCKPRGSKLVAATQYQVLTQGDMELPLYIEKCRQITDACGWPEDAKDTQNSLDSKSSGVSEMLGREPGYAYSLRS